MAKEKIKVNNKKVVKAKEKVKVKPKKKNRKVIKKRIILVIFILIIGLAIAGAIYLFTSSKFCIKEVKIKNNKYYSTEDILKKVSIKKGTNMFRISSSKILKKLKDMPYIESVEIDRSLNGKITVKVKERASKYLAYNKETGGYVRLSDTGVILELKDRAEKTEEELLVFGINFDDNLKIGEKIVELEYNKIELYNMVYAEYIKNNITKKITSVKFENDTIILVLDNNLSVIFEQKDLAYDMSLLNDILKEIEGQPGTVDMTRPDPVFSLGV